MEYTKNGNANQAAENHQKSDSERTSQQINFQIYEHYIKISSLSDCLKQELTSNLQEKYVIQEKLNQYAILAEQFRDTIRKSSPQKKKKHRRNAQEIQKSYFCDVEKCERFYSTEGSLKNHIKIKHPELLNSWDKQKKTSQKIFD